MKFKCVLKFVAFKSNLLHYVYSLNQVLLTVIWLRRYPTICDLASKFSIPSSTAHRIIHRILPMLHVVTVPKYIIWHSPNEWNALAGTNNQWPQVVGVLDGTPFRISRPAGQN